MIPLKIITEYSLLKSLIKLPDLINFLLAHKIKACGICDDELFGTLDFYYKCRENNIKPLIGLEVKISDFEVYVYAKNYLGFKKIIKINSQKSSNKLNFTDLQDSNLLVILPYESLDIYEEIYYKDNLYLGYSNIIQKEALKKYDSKQVYAPKVRTLLKDDINYLKYLQAMGGDFTYDENCYLKLESIFAADNEYFCNQIDLEIPEGKRYIPKYLEKADSYTYLKNLANIGLKKRMQENVPKNYQERLDMELDVIKSMGFIDYFLIVYDYVFYAKKNNILVGPGRGSAAGSLVSYAIGITDVDPIKYDLLFARFLNPYRQKMPDIDIDFEDSKRMDVINYVKERYGRDNVALGLTFNTLKSKLVLRECGKILKIDNNLLEGFIKKIDASKNLKENFQNVEVKKYLSLYKELNELYDISIHLENLKKNASTHAAGVVISSVPLNEVIPTYFENNTLKTGIAMDYLEKLGLLKMDFLALRNLSFINTVIKKIPGFNLNNIPLEDPKTLEVFKTAQTQDIFQFESTYAQNNLLKLKVSSFEELCIAIALVRPGPSAQIDNYVKNKNNQNYHMIPELESILKSTYGVIIFQEQVMKIFEVIGGLTPFEADNVRVAISKKKVDIIKKEQKRFVQNALEKGYSESFACDLFNKILRFSEYGFNKAHSVSYALIAYQIAYLKVWFPKEFYLSMLQLDKSLENKKKVLTNLKAQNVKILKPNINVSNHDFQFKNGYLLLPFSMIKNFNEQLINNILKVRDHAFLDIYDFVLRCKDFLTNQNFEMLVLSGTLDTFGINQKTLILNKEKLLNYAYLNDKDSLKPLLEISDDYTEAQLRQFENDYYGFYIGNHPCSVYQNVIKACNITNYLFKNIEMVLLIDKIRVIKTKTGEQMAFVEASDETGSVDLTLFPKTFKMENIKENDLVYIKGKCSKRFDKYQIIVNNIKRK